MDVNQETIQNILNNASVEVIEPETIRSLIPDLTEEDFNHLQALITIKTSNYAFENFYVFENVVRALNGIVPNIKMIEGAEPEWIWYACEIIKMLRPNMELSQEVIEYIRKIYADKGIYFLHPYVTKTKGYIDMSTYSQIYAAAKHKAINGPKPIEPNSFINRQGIEYLKIKLYSDNLLKEEK